MAAVRLQLRRPQWPLLFASLAIAVCVVAIFYALDVAVTGTEGQKLPEAIESIDPVRSAVQVPSQTSIVVDLVAGYEGVLVIDGLELQTVRLDELQDITKPGQQVTLPATTIYEPGNATLTFTPSDNAPVKEFTQGQHVVKVIYWRTVDGRASARSYSWTFEVF